MAASRPSFAERSKAEYYESHDPFAQERKRKRQQYEQSHFNYKQTQQFQTNQSADFSGKYHTNNSIFNASYVYRQKNDHQYKSQVKQYQSKYDKYKNLQQHVSMPTMKENIVLPSVVQYGDKYGGNRDIYQNKGNDRYNVPSLSPIIQMNKAYIEQQENFENMPYNPKSGFVIRLDSVTNLPENIDTLIMEYAIQDTEGVLYQTEKTKPHHLKNSGQQTLYLNERKHVKGVDGVEDDYLYFELQVRPANHKFYYSVGSLVKLFDKQGALQDGLYKIPFYDLADLGNPTEFLNGEGKYIKPVNRVYLNLRIAFQTDLYLDNDRKIKFSEYNTPDVYKKTRKPQETGLNGNPNSKIKMKPLQTKYDMDTLNKHMKDMKDISKGKLKTDDEKKDYDSRLGRDSADIAVSQIEFLNNSPQKKNNGFSKYKNSVKPVDKTSSRMSQAPSFQNSANNISPEKSRFADKPKTQQPTQESAESYYELKETVSVEKIKDPLGGLKVKCLRMEKFEENGALAFDLYLLGPNGQVQDRMGEPCEGEADQVYDGDPSDKVCHMDLEFKLYKNPFVLRRDNPQIYKDYHIVFNFILEQNEEESDFGWYACKVFKDDGTLNLGEIRAQIYESPLQEKIPYDYSKIKKITPEFVFQIDYEIFKQ